MTTFIFQQNKFRVNSLQLSRKTLLKALASIFHQFPKQDEFTIKEINYASSDKTIRAIIFIFEQFGYLEVCESREIIPKKYRFKSNDLSAMMNDLKQIGIIATKTNKIQWD
jgi:hypothetical protein